MRLIQRFFRCALLFGLLAACTHTDTVIPDNTPVELTAPAAVTNMPAETRLPAPTRTLPAADPVELGVLTIDELRARSYGGELEVTESLGKGTGFTRTEFWYTSDGVRVAGYVSVPEDEGPFPVIILLHGYDSSYRNYGILNYTQLYTDNLAEAGFLVLHPNLRSFGPSESGPNPLCTGFVVDVLNLIAIVQDQAGRPGLLEQADPARIGLWGHSMGGGIAQRVMVASPAVDAAVVYAGMPSDERINLDQVYPTFRDDLCEVAGLELTEEDFAQISAIDNLERTDAAVYVAHGEADSVVPHMVSQNLCLRLEAAGRTFECVFVPGQGHEFSGEASETFREEVVRFYRDHLR